MSPLTGSGPSGKARRPQGRWNILPLVTLVSYITLGLIVRQAARTPTSIDTGRAEGKYGEAKARREKRGTKLKKGKETSQGMSSGGGTERHRGGDW